MGTGYLKIEATSGSDALPVIGASVTVTDTDGSILFETTTDMNGQTEEYPIEAPDERNSEYLEEGVPYYALVNIEVEADGYIPKQVNGIKIFDTQTTIWPAHMLPMPVGGVAEPYTATLDDETEVNENAEQPAPSFSPYILKDVIIPDYITVHLGYYTSSAANVRVPFTDYIKNAASREIFPTWRPAALEANIYAIISFTLNRVYTEYYPSRGYPFNITNSTGMDQSYNPDGEIYKSISDIVDRIFNQYIIRQGTQEPFFAQYCKGSCAGMSQEGSQQLALQGYSAMNILKYYYPSDIVITTSNNIQGIEASYPGTPLREGSQGESVRMIQMQLNRIHGDYPGIPYISNPNGVFGSDTTASVKAFQKSVDLQQDGVVGQTTWYRLSQRYAAVKKLSDLSSEGERIGIGTTPPTSVLNLNSRGREVVELQFILNMIAQFYNSVPPVVETGRYDAQTQASVAAFQRMVSLNADGIVGPTTWQALYQIYWGIENTTPPSTGGDERPVYPGSLLRVGSSGSNVLLMQQYLNVIRTRYPSIPRLTEDGAFGSGTQAAVREFQRLFGLSQDGIIGPGTWNRIVDEYFDIIENGNTGGGGSGTSPVYPGTVLKVGSRGESVRLMQEYLNRIADVYTAIPKITADGIYGSSTQAAVLAFQRQFGLSQDGQIGPITWNRIVEVYNGLGSTDYDPIYPGTLLREGSRGNAVTVMQQYLSRLSQAYTTIPRPSVDGIYGSGTRASVVAFQQRFGLSADGIIGPATWDRIVDEYNKVAYARSSEIEAQYNHNTMPVLLFYMLFGGF